MKTILLFTLVILTIAISGCQDKKKTKDTKTQKEAVNVENKAVFIKDTIPTTETVTENTAVKEAPEYFLTVAASASKTMQIACMTTYIKKAIQMPSSCLIAGIFISLPTKDTKLRKKRLQP